MTGMSDPHDLEYLAEGLARKYPSYTREKAIEMVRKYPKFIRRIVQNYMRLLAAVEAGQTGNIDPKPPSQAEKYGYVEIRDRGFARARELRRRMENPRVVTIEEVRNAIAAHPVLRGMEVISEEQNIEMTDLEGISIFCKLVPRWSRRDAWRCHRLARKKFGLTSVGVIRDTSLNDPKYKKKFPKGRVSHYNVILAWTGKKIGIGVFDCMNGRPIVVRKDNYYHKGETGTITF